MINGKAQVVSSILKLDRPFRPPHIVDMTGLDRQLVYYHLRTFCDSGMLLKTGKVYQIADKEALFDSLLNITESTETHLMKKTKLIEVIGYNKVAETLVSLLVLDPQDELAREVKQAYVAEIDKTIQEFKNLRKFIHNSQRGEKSAAKYLKDMFASPREIYEAWVRDWDITPVEEVDEWTQRFKIAIEDTLEA
jgi:hypothetical protein